MKKYGNKYYSLSSLSLSPLPPARASVPVYAHARKVWVKEGRKSQRTLLIGTPPSQIGNINHDSSML
jgi:hypothetical protein